MEALASSIMIFDKNNNIEYMNPSAETLFEVSRNHAAGNNITTFFDDPNFFKRTLSKAKKQQRDREIEE